MTCLGQVKFYDGVQGFGHITSVGCTDIYKFKQSGLRNWGEGQVPRVGVIVMYDIEEEEYPKQEPGMVWATNVSLQVLSPLEPNTLCALGVEAISKVKKMSVDDRDAKKASKTRTEVEELIMLKYPSAKVYLCGSQAQGLATRKSDDDIAVDPGGKGTFVIGLEAQQKAVSELYALFVKGWGPFVPDEETMTDCLERIVTARVPIVKYKIRQRQWDVCVEGSGVRSSLWLRLFFKDDPNLRVTAIWVKNWFMEAGMLDSSRWLSSYAVVTLVVYYAVATFKATDFDPAEVQVSEKDVCPDFLGRAGEGADPEKVGKLIAGFFEFYYNFNFAKDVVTLNAKFPPMKWTKQAVSTNGLNSPRKQLVKWTKQQLKWNFDKDVDTHSVDPARQKRSSLSPFTPQRRETDNYFFCIQDTFSDENLSRHLNESKSKELFGCIYAEAVKMRQQSSSSLPTSVNHGLTHDASSSGS